MIRPKSKKCVQLITIVSGFSPDDERFGYGFMQSFDRYWPKDIKLIVYVEKPVRHISPRIEQRCLWGIPGAREFRSIQDLQKNGRESIPGRWNKKDEREGYSYRYDAVRFSPQLFIPDHAAKKLPNGSILVWFDADVLTYHEVPDNLINRLMTDQGGDYDLVTLGRDGSSTELGFWACRLGPKIREMLASMADCCRDGTIFQLHEWHSGYVFDHWVDRYRVDRQIKHKSLTSGHGHIWFKCEIGKYTDHLKGATRKQLGYSPERHGETVKQFLQRLP